jgi:hypothetical protein
LRGTLNKKMGLRVTSTKPQDGERTYRIISKYFPTTPPQLVLSAAAFFSYTLHSSRACSPRSR